MELKLDIGCGEHRIDGYTPIDRAIGLEAYPLDFEDNSVDEIRASHVLEHFSHTNTVTVLKHWVSKLRPGGLLKIAVPDFQKVVVDYLAGKPINTMGYVCGGHSDDNDIHLCVFDAETLTEAMVAAGLERIQPWVSEIQDCAALPISLNLCGYKPHEGDKHIPNTIAVLATARFGPSSHHECAYVAFRECGIPYMVHSSCFWEQTISNQLERAIADPRIKYVITGDFDSLFTTQDVRELYRLMEAYGVDAIAPWQSKRNGKSALWTLRDDNWRIINEVYTAEFNRNLTRINTAHFGLTIIRADKLRALPRPWMHAEPAPDGTWGEGHVDYDISFWRNWQNAGNNLYLANHVVLGHLAEVVIWPTEDMTHTYQHINDYQAHGKPAEARK